jgi:hypothetical protein
LVGFAWAYLILSETPRGQVKGVTVLTDANGKPLSACDVYLTPASRYEEDGTPIPRPPGPDSRERRHVLTDGTGHFSLRDVPAGTYSLSASARYHSTPGVTITVEEGKTIENTLRLARSEADLSVGDHQATFATSETPFLPVRGYSTTPDEANKSKKTPLKIKVWQTRLSEVLKRDESANDFSKLRYSYGTPAVLTKALLSPKDGNTPKLIADTAIPITGADREGFFTSRLPLGRDEGQAGTLFRQVLLRQIHRVLLRPGHEPCPSRQEDAARMVAYTAELQKGTPIPRATIRILRNGNTLVSGQTGADGVTRLPYPIPWRYRTARTASRRSRWRRSGMTRPSLTVLPMATTEAPVSTSCIPSWTARSTAPGDTVQYKGIVRQRNDSEDGRQGYSIPRGTPVSVEIRDATGGLVKRESKTTGNAGTFWGDFEISPEGSTGSYMMVTTVGGEPSNTDITVAASVSRSSPSV